jgi:hypothetical protein
MRPAVCLLLACAVAACSSQPQNTAQTHPPAPSATEAAPAPHPGVDPGATGSTSASADPPQPVDPPAPSGPPPPLPKGTVVLHVGDSMADALGKSLKLELGERGIKNVLKAKEATYIPQWAGFTMGFKGLVQSNNPDLVIITLGGNEVAMPDPTIRAEPVREMVKQVGDRPCLWIAAPLWPGSPNTGILEVIKQNCAPCIYVDTNELIPDLERLGDKVHPTIPERKRWAKFMIRWLRHNRDPNGKRPWDFKQPTEAPPPESVDWPE